MTDLLTIDEFEQAAQRTMDPQTSNAERLVNAALGLAGEVGEIAEIVADTIAVDYITSCALEVATLSGKICDAIKKAHFHGKPIDHAALWTWLKDLSELTSRSWREREMFAQEAANRSLDIEHLGEEIGDAGWYLAQACKGAGLRLSDVLAANNRKLEARYQDGFSFEASASRDVAREQAAMRGNE